MIKMNDFKAEPEDLIQQELLAVERVLRSGCYILGKEVEKFEQRWATYCGVNFGVGVGNGMDALEIGLRSLQIGPGDEVITTPMTAFATVLAILRSGATPVLADIDPETALLDPKSVERCISSHTKAVLLVHLYGQVREMERWTDLCHNAGIYLLEDCAQAHLAQWQGHIAGSFGTWGAYSFYPTKNLGAIGDAGILVTQDETIAQQAKVLRNYGQTERYHHPELGLNSRLDELQAALLLARLDCLEAFTLRRQQIAQQYFLGIKNHKIQLLAPPISPENHVYHLFVVRCTERDHLSAYLKDKNIENLYHYPIPIHYQKSIQNIKWDPKGLYCTEQHANQCLSIPCHPYLNDQSIEYVTEALNAFQI